MKITPLAPTTYLWLLPVILLLFPGSADAWNCCRTSCIPGPNCRTCEPIEGSCAGDTCAASACVHGDAGFGTEGISAKKKRNGEKRYTFDA